MTNNKTTKHGNETTSNEEVLNVFDSMPTIATDDSSKSRKLDYTPLLISRSTERATEIMLGLKDKPELIELANKTMRDLDPNDLFQLCSKYHGETIQSDATLLDGCDADQLSRLLESRRSDRSKLKKKNPITNKPVARQYIAAMYAELLVRVQLKKPYTGSTSSNSYDIETISTDAVALGKKVKSLQSKKCRLAKLAPYDINAKQELTEVEAEIARLNQFRPTVKTVSTTSLAGIDIAALKTLLADTDTSKFSAEDAEKYEALIARLG